MAEWVVNWKAGPDRDCFEIAVVRDCCEHQKSSYGWFDENKLLISHSGGPCGDRVTSTVWEKLIKVAHEVCSEMNKEVTGG